MPLTSRVSSPESHSRRWYGAGLLCLAHGVGTTHIRRIALLSRAFGDELVAISVLQALVGYVWFGNVES